MWLNAPICEECWRRQEPNRTPHRLLGEVACTKCGDTVSDPVYVRAEWPERDEAQVTDLDLLRALHRKANCDGGPRCHTHSQPHSWCGECDQTWPCRTIEVLDG